MMQIMEQLGNEAGSQDSKITTCDSWRTICCRHVVKDSKQEQAKFPATWGFVFS